VYALKRRTDSKALLALMDNPSKLSIYVEDVPDVALQLIETADSPLTIIYDGAMNLAPSLCAEDGSIGIRITSELFSNNLCRQFRKPIVSTSANVSGEPSPANYSDISDVIRQGVDYIVNYRQKDTTKSKPSHIIRIGAGGLFKILR
jgi:L-threonylcarbamoyladenylate synthase